MIREMVGAGVANIMAYSWFSHCKKYLEALELEKRFTKTQKVHIHLLIHYIQHVTQSTRNFSTSVRRVGSPLRVAGYGCPLPMLLCMQVHKISSCNLEELSFIMRLPLLILFKVAVDLGPRWHVCLNYYCGMLIQYATILWSGR